MESPVDVEASPHLTAPDIDGPLPIIATVMGGLSMIGSIAVIGTSLLLPEFRKQLSQGRALLVMLSSADFLQGLFFSGVGVYNTDPDSWSCTVVGAFGIITSVASFIATAWVAWWVRYSIVNPDVTKHSSFCLPFAVSFGYPVVMLGGLIGYAVHEWSSQWKVAFQPTQHFPWCFLADEPHWAMLLWRLMVEYFPLIVSMVITAGCYFSAVKHLQNQELHLYVCVQNAAEISAIKTKFLVIVAAFLVIRTPGMVARIVTLITVGGRVMPWLRYLVILTDPSQGFVNGIIFTFGTRTVREEVWNYVTGKKKSEPPRQGLSPGQPPSTGESPHLGEHQPLRISREFSPGSYQTSISPHNGDGRLSQALLNGFRQNSGILSPRDDSETPQAAR